jgi:GT2 family glycosyltransferase
VIDEPIENISVIIVNHNRKDLLRNCLHSLLQQHGIAFEIVVVDNGSQDGSAEMIKREFPGCSIPIQVIRNEDNRGFCAANNQGIAKARGEFLALLNNDAEAEPGWLATLRQAFQQPDVGMAASKILVYDDPSRIDKVGHVIYLDGQNRGRGFGETDHGQYDRIEEVLWPDGCAAMYRRAMIEEIGGFDEDFFAYADDAELGLRARIAGWRCLYMPGAVVRHHRGATLGKQSLWRMELIERNRVLLAAKLFPWSLLWLNGVFYAIRLLAGAWATMTGQGEISNFPGLRKKLQVAMAMLRADYRAIGMLPRMLRKRKHILRRITTRQLRILLCNNSIPLRQLSRKVV